jgi:hypothetical protein
MRRYSRSACRSSSYLNSAIAADANSASAFRKAIPSKMADSLFVDHKHARDLFLFRHLTNAAILFASQFKEGRS